MAVVNQVKGSCDPDVFKALRVVEERARITKVIQKIIRDLEPRLSVLKPGDTLYHTPVKYLDTLSISTIAFFAPKHKSATISFGFNLDGFSHPILSGECSGDPSRLLDELEARLRLLVSSRGWDLVAEEAKIFAEIAESRERLHLVENNIRLSWQVVYSRRPGTNSPTKVRITREQKDGDYIMTATILLFDNEVISHVFKCDLLNFAQLKEGLLSACNKFSQAELDYIKYRQEVHARGMET